MGKGCDGLASQAVVEAVQENLMGDHDEAIWIVLEILVTVVLVGLSIWWMTAQWKECKAEGFSTFYCIQHIT